MGAAAWKEARLALAGTLRLAIGDRGGLACFDRSLDGFWRSFRAAVICYPLYLVLLAMRVSLAEWERSGGWRIVTVETIGYVIAWVAFPLLMLSVTRVIGNDGELTGYGGGLWRKRRLLDIEQGAACIL